MRVVVKFGGSSLRYDFYDAVQFVKMLEDENEVAVVVSALKGVTDKLELLYKTGDKKILGDILLDYINFAKKHGISIDAIKLLAEELSSALSLNFPNDKVKRDFLLSFGELFSASIFAQAIDGVLIEPWDIIVTDGNFGNAEVDITKTRNLFACVRDLMEDGKVPVIPGFIGGFRGFRTTLGRGGSDYTAVVAGICIKAKAVLIMSDVEGIYTADPKVVREAKPIPFVSYDEALIASKFGMRAIQWKAVKLASENEVPLLFGKTKGWWMGTLVSKESSGMPIIAYRLRDTHGIVGVVNAYPRVPYERISEGENWVAFKVPKDETEKAVREIHREIMEKYLPFTKVISVIGT
ncbi:aspartate kinase [Thermococcus paralvinellae]|uniref:Putative Aspartokinase n=1 Tax=Thermococcus paralvinellae TaxID=582419 RepID=W0I0S2_9EURY|nr:aspartate kinase [Thermococcus paralvinellae]AHF79646.1 putative Aspartokinase [Thermococcus paralvinellae]